MGLLIRLIELLLVLVPLAGVAYATFRGIVALRARDGAVERPGIPDPNSATAGQRRAIDRALKQHDLTDTRWLDYELDVAKLLDYPLMSDLRDPHTERFHRAKLRSDVLRPIQASDLLADRDAMRAYLEAVAEYTTAFDIAEAEAYRRKRTTFTDAEQDRLVRAQRLLRVAGDTAATPQERDRAYQLAQRELQGLLVLPERARIALERGISGELDN